MVKANSNAWIGGISMAPFYGVTPPIPDRLLLYNCISQGERCPAYIEFCLLVPVELDVSKYCQEKIHYFNS